MWNDGVWITKLFVCLEFSPFPPDDEMFMHHLS